MGVTQVVKARRLGQSVLLMRLLDRPLPAALVPVVLLDPPAIRRTEDEVLGAFALACALERGDDPRRDRDAPAGLPRFRGTEVVATMLLKLELTSAVPLPGPADTQRRRTTVKVQVLDLQCGQLAPSQPGADRDDQEVPVGWV